MRSKPHDLGRLAAAVALTSILTGCAALQGSGSRTGGEGEAWRSSRYSLLPSDSHYELNASSIPDDVVFDPRSAYGASDLQVQHPKIDAFVLAYETRSRNFFERALDRSRRYVPRMAAILQEEGLPPELAYLPLIESGFNNRAVSPAGAVGPWQFIRATGQRYGLRIDRYVDERRDPDKSTRAAAQYLRDLYNMFGDWHLSLAAYNTGEYRVARTMDREGTDSYWDLMENRDLHPETCDYVPRFLAALAIAQAPEAHGFERPDPAPVKYDHVETDRSVSLRTIANLVGTSETEIRDLNPALVRGVTPPGPSGYRLNVPAGKKDTFEVAYARMRREARDAQADPYVVAGDGRSHKVRRGDTVAAIARRMGVSTAALMRTNGIKNARALRVGQVLRVPGSSAPARAAVASSSKGRGRPAAAAPAKSQSYKVRKGDTVAGIARRFGVAEKQIIAANGLKNPRALRIGATLRIPAKASRQPVRVAKRR